MKYLTLLASAYLLAAGAHGAEIKGTIKLVSGDLVSVAIEGDVMPPVDARAEIFFKLPGDEEEISVATGSALVIDHGDLKVKIEKTTGTVEKGQLVRFPDSSTSTTSSITTTVTQPPVAKNSIVGEWVANLPDKGTLTFVFREDGTTTWAGATMKANGKYRVDYTATPHEVDITDIDVPEAKGFGFYGIFEFQADGTMKMIMTEKVSERPTSYDNHDTIIFSRAKEGGTSQSSPSIVGNWVGSFHKGENYSFTFNPDQTVTWIAESSETQKKITVHAKYRLDNTAKPGRLDLFDLDKTGLAAEGEILHGLFELQEDSKLKMDLSVGANEHPEKGFTDAAIIFSRVPEF